MQAEQRAENQYIRLNNELNMPDSDGNIRLYKDAEAVKDYIENYVQPRMRTFGSLMQKLSFLTGNGYYEEGFLAKLHWSTIVDVFKRVEEENFQFRSFMGAYKFYRQYALVTTDGEEFLESYNDRVAINALYLANGNDELAYKLVDVMIKQEYQPATPTFMNAGKKERGEFTSCFLLEVSDDLNSIGRSINSALQLSKIGGGVAMNLSNVRSMGDPIKKNNNKAAGVVKVMKLYEDSFTYADQMGVRQGSGAAYLNVFHPDIYRFLDTKKENADEKIRMKTLSLGLIVPDKFLELAMEGKPMYTFSPYDIRDVYGKTFSEINMTESYDELLNDKRIRKYEIDPRDLENTISELQQESGYPYIFFEDSVNEQNPLREKVKFSNLCTEILQPSLPAVLGDEQNYLDIGRDISCNLGSVNIVNLMKSSDFGDSVETMFRGLTYVADSFSIDTVPSIREGNKKAKAVGLGAMNLHGFLAKNYIEYGSEESIDFVSTFFMMLNYHTLKASNKLAQERGEVFDLFANSTYADGTYFEKYESQDWSPNHQRIQKLFEGIDIPTKEDWEQLKEDVMEYGLYNQNRMAVAPTGSISYIQEATSALMPINDRIEKRREGKTGETFYPAPYMDNDNMKYYTAAKDMDMRKVIDVHAAAQEHVDQGISLTLTVRSDIPFGLYEWKNDSENPTAMTTRDLNLIRRYAWSKNIKTLYYVRPFSDNKTEETVVCESCTV